MFSASVYFQQPISGLSRRSGAIFHRAAPRTDSCVMAPDCWCLVEWSNMENTATISMSCRYVSRWRLLIFRE